MAENDKSEFGVRNAEVGNKKIRILAIGIRKLEKKRGSKRELWLIGRTVSEIRKGVTLLLRLLEYMVPKGGIEKLLVISTTY